MSVFSFILILCRVVAQNSELISQTSMQNALIAKSNVTSEQLMKDVKYIKTYGVEIR